MSVFIFLFHYCNEFATNAPMYPVPVGFQKFLFSEQHQVMLVNDFKLLIKGSTLAKCSQTVQVIKDYKKKPAVYFWVMRVRDRLFRIYVGKTNSMSYRVDNYISEYQPHSPNDFKMRIFYNFIKINVPGAELDLYFRTEHADSLTEVENQAIKIYAPLLNHRNKPSEQAEDLLRSAYESYYLSSFERMLLDGDEDRHV